MTHSPARQWCPHCVKRGAKNSSHRATRKEVPDVEADMIATATTSVDLMYLYEKGVKPTLVAIDHESGRVWSYAWKDKTFFGGTGWIQKRLAQDIDNAAHKEVKLMIKSDQETVICYKRHLKYKGKCLLMFKC